VAPPWHPDFEHDMSLLDPPFLYGYGFILHWGFTFAGKESQVPKA
jgi:hypothetical protein